VDYLTGFDSLKILNIKITDVLLNKIVSSASQVKLFKELFEKKPYQVKESSFERSLWKVSDVKGREFSYAYFI